jgi:hypothetical protein
MIREQKGSVMRYGTIEQARMVSGVKSVKNELTVRQASR